MNDTHRAYLARLGVEAEGPSVDALFRLHRAHVERVPYETVWIHLGEARTVDADESLERIAVQRRGGYCFQLNGAFGQLLRALGYRVTRHVGGVHGPDGPAPSDLTNHLVLTVDGLPTFANPDGVWYVDAGLGDALHEPMALVEGPVQQGPYRLTLSRVGAGGDGVGDWHMAHDPIGSFTGMSWSSRPAEMGDFAQRHEFLATSPDSKFVKVLVVQRRHADGADVLRGLVVTHPGVSTDETVIVDRDGFGSVLRDVFDLDLDRIGPDAVDRLWTRTRTIHERFSGTV